jgi:protein arginine kinase activator
MELPLCDVCGERPATVHIQVIGADVHQEMRLCAQCATEYEMDLLPFTLEVSPDGEIDISLRHPQSAPGAKRVRELPNERCAGCGTTSSEVAGTGLVGCPECYDDLPATVAGLVATLQPGYTPAMRPPQELPPILSELARLQLALAEAVADEDYDRAARLRDTIRQTGAS